MEDTLDLAIQIVDALDAADREGIVHRDLRPRTAGLSGFKNVALHGRHLFARTARQRGHKI
jgi:hypothetical protein